MPGLEGVWTFLAVSQVAVGALVLSGRWALLGLLALLPLNIGIFAYTVGNHWQGTPYVNGFFLLLNLLALAAERPSWWHLMQPTALGSPKPARFVCLWPGWHLPLLTFTWLVLAVLSSQVGAPVVFTAAFGALGFASAWRHTLRADDLATLERIALALPGAALILLSVAPIANKLWIPYVMLAGLVAGIVALIVVTAIRLRSSRALN